MQSPVRITNWDDPARFLKRGDFSVPSAQASPAPLVEDTLFVVQATKSENRETLQLNQAVVVLVRPRSDPKMTAQDSLVAQGTAGTVQISNTQRGVRYQLLKRTRHQWEVLATIGKTAVWKPCGSKWTLLWDKENPGAPAEFSGCQRGRSLRRRPLASWRPR